MINVAGYSFPDDRAAIVCTHIWDGRPVLLFTHDSDGDIQFYCGAENHTAEDALVMGVAEISDRLHSIDDIPTVKPGYYADRSMIGAAWASKKLTTECRLTADRPRKRTVA